MRRAPTRPPIIPRPNGANAWENSRPPILAQGFTQGRAGRDRRSRPHRESRDTRTAQPRGTRPRHVSPSHEDLGRVGHGDEREPEELRALADQSGQPRHNNAPRRCREPSLGGASEAIGASRSRPLGKHSPVRNNAPHPRHRAHARAGPAGTVPSRRSRIRSNRPAAVLTAHRRSGIQRNRCMHPWASLQCDASRTAGR